MYDKNKIYKFRLQDNFFLTGKIIEEDEMMLKIYTIKKEERIISKNMIIASWVVEE